MWGQALPLGPFFEWLPQPARATVGELSSTMSTITNFFGLLTMWMIVGDSWWYWVRRESTVIDYHVPFDQAFRELKQTTTATKTTANKKGLMSRTLAVHVRCKYLYISRPSTAEQHREMTKFCALWRTWASTAMVTYFVLEFFAGRSYLSLSKAFRHRLVCWEGSDSYEGRW